MRSITLLSPAKVNLTLEVLSRRADGYHEIRSIMQPVSLFDEVSLEVAANSPLGIEVASSGIKTPRGEDNLAWRAASLFVREGGMGRLGVKISIKKKIPLGAGLGGGSSNAAATLVGLNRLTKKFTQGELVKLSAQIGADVPFFIHCRAAIAEGIGERLTQIRDFPLYHYVIVHPGFETSTKTVYEKWDETAENSPAPQDAAALFKSGGHPLGNDLEKPAAALYPQIQKIKETLTGLGAKAVSMTGSGSSVYAVFANEREAREIYDYLQGGDSLSVFLAEAISGWHRLF
ncbi:MAG: 4-(cytidine 5'-diphospho)-2-C-methyl-D-erythritol kinase [Deltaproteobacteria bacterium]